MTDQEKRYIDRPIEEEGLSFEAFVNLENLRLQQQTKLSAGERHLMTKQWGFKNGDPVRISLIAKDKNGNHQVELVGYVTDNSKSDWRPIVTVGDKEYQNYVWIKKRHMIDYSGVVVRPEIKDMQTKQLLTEYRRLRKRGDYSTMSGKPMTGNYMDEMKAELSTRENIETKYERKLNKSK